MVIVNVGIMTRDNFGLWKPVRGKKLPIKIEDNATAEMLKQTAISKHASHDQLFGEFEDYVLLYPDGKEVLLLPGAPGGQSKFFTLDEYKEELCKPYSQLTFYLCLSSVYNEFVHELQEYELPVPQLSGDKAIDSYCSTDDSDTYTELP